MLPEVLEGRHNVAHGGSRGNKAGNHKKAPAGAALRAHALCDRTEMAATFLKESGNDQLA